MSKNRLIIIMAALVAALAVSFYIFDKPRDSISDEAPDFIIGAEELTEEFLADEIAAEEKYSGKIITVSGQIEQLDSNGEKGATCRLLAGANIEGVLCEFEPGNTEKILSKKIGDSVTIKGRFSGYLMDVVLNTCSVRE